MNILVFFAHPDDETILCGGTLALLARAGAEVHYLCATRGEGGELGEPPLCERAELGAVRAAELECAVEALGGASLTFLDYVDPVVGEDGKLHPYTTDLDALAAQLLAHIGRLNAAVVLTHGSDGEYGHPAHWVTHQAARRMIDALGDAAPLLYTFSASFPRHPRPRLANPDDPAHIVLDIAPAFEQKVAAARCHRTQNALFVRRSSQKAGRPLSIPEVLMKLEGLHRVHPPLTGDAPQDALAALLAPWSQPVSHE